MSIQSPDWWRGAVIYQIYPRSFMDSNGDGIGDLPGITQKLDYVARLGVDAIWLSPFFKSPMKDYGYDIADYRDVDPMFGTLEDFDSLVHKAHMLGLRVMIDQVLSHTSDQHAWFQESRRDRDNPRADWYVWADPKPDGTPPNNWLSVFGGSAWQWDSRRQQYYLHNFLVEQPDLNFHNPDVVRQMLEEVEFWLKRGVDGLRLDVVNFYFHDARLRDNPPWDRTLPRRDGTRFSNPYAYQQHLYDRTRPENLVFLRCLRALLDRYPGTTMVGEIADDDPTAIMAEYTSGGDKLHMTYSFDLLTERFGAAYIRQVVEALETRLGDGWPCWSLGNHDFMRVLTRWGGTNPPEGLAQVLMALLLSLRGSACIYQGEELGLTQAEIPRERLRDPYGIAFWPEFKGRDGCRTPMPWRTGAPHAGFSSMEPWLPIPEEHRHRAVDIQDGRPDSILEAYQRFLRWRRTQPALVRGDLAFIDAPENVLALVRIWRDERILAVFNLSGGEVAVSKLLSGLLESLEGYGLPTAQSGEQITLPAFGVFFGRLGNSATLPAAAHNHPPPLQE